MHAGAKLLTAVSKEAERTFLDRAARLAEELKRRRVELEVRFLEPAQFSSIHDRWIGNGKRWLNVPPLNSWLKGQHAEIKPSSFSHFQELWDSAAPVVLGLGAGNPEADAEVAGRN